MDDTYSCGTATTFLICGGDINATKRKRKKREIEKRRARKRYLHHCSHRAQWEPKRVLCECVREKESSHASCPASSVCFLPGLAGDLCPPQGSGRCDRPWAFSARPHDRSGRRDVPALPAARSYARRMRSLCALRLAGAPSPRTSLSSPPLTKTQVCARALTPRACPIRVRHACAHRTSFMPSPGKRKVANKAIIEQRRTWRWRGPGKRPRGRFSPSKRRRPTSQ